MRDLRAGSAASSPDCGRLEDRPVSRPDRLTVDDPGPGRFTLDKGHA
ncbi:hypothetical protein [Streptomyces tendae]